MIFAKVDVELRDHERAHRAGAAMATWTWALLWTRAKERNGFVAAEALRGSWVGERLAVRDMAKLVTAGLVEPVEGGWLLCGYAEKNDTRDEIEVRKADQRKRKAEWTERKRNASGATTGNALPTRSERVSNFPEPEPEPEPEPDLRERESARAGGPATIDLDAPMPGWAADRVAALRISLGPTTAEIPAEWSGFLAHAAKCRTERRPFAVDAATWQAWLTKAWTFARRSGPAKASTSSPASPETLEHREAYEAGLRAAVGQVGFAWSPALDESLREAIRVHAKNRKGQPHAGPVLAEWIRAAASDFGHELRGGKEDPKFLSDGEPKGFLRWLNREEMRKEQRHVDGRAER